MARSHIVAVAKNFWNIRSSFKIAHLIDVGTHASLVKLKSGSFVLLDACTLSGKVKAKVDELTRNGADIAAIINVHPFHTVHVRKVHEQYPQARLYGTVRHVERFPDLPWEMEHTEDPRLHELFADDLEFSIPRGVEFISANENIHFSSVLVYHRSSQTLHVDDTLMLIQMPAVIRRFGLQNYMGFHPTLAQALEKRAGAAREFRLWAEELAANWSDANNLCAAHNGILRAQSEQKASIHDRILKALQNASRTLATHKKRYG